MSSTPRAHATTVQPLTTAPAQLHILNYTTQTSLSLSSAKMYLLNLTTSVLLAFATSAMAQIQSIPGFTTTSLFMPGATFTPYLTSLGSNDSTTTWGAANSSKGLETPYLLVTLGLTNMLFSMTNTYVSLLTSLSVSKLSEERSNKS